MSAIRCTAHPDADNAYKCRHHPVHPWGGHLCPAHQEEATLILKSMAGSTIPLPPGPTATEKALLMANDALLRAEERRIQRNAAGFEVTRVTPTCTDHYAGTVTPWDLQKCMKSSGNAFVDARRADVMEYAFRIKDDLLGDLIKARHCLDEAITVLKETAAAKNTYP